MHINTCWFKQSGKQQGFELNFQNMVWLLADTWDVLCNIPATRIIFEEQKDEKTQGCHQSKLSAG